MAVRVIGSWYYTSELPAEEAATLRAAMVTKNCESLETWLKTSVHDADRKARLYALLRHAAFESWLAGLELLIKYDADVNPPHKASKALRGRRAPSGLGRRRRAAPEKSLRRRAARGTVPKGHHLLGAGLEVSPMPSPRRHSCISARNNYHYLSYTH